MNARSTMKHRAFAQRDSNTAKDVYNQKLPPNWQTLATIPCFSWQPDDRHVDTVDKVANVRTILALMPLTADITETDRILKITDRLNRQRFPGPMSVLRIIRKEDHILVQLQRVA